MTRKTKFQPSAEQEAIRRPLVELRDALLHLHKALLDSERAVDEKEIGPIHSPNHFFQLLTKRSFFSSDAGLGANPSRYLSYCSGSRKRRRIRYWREFPSRIMSAIPPLPSHAESADAVDFGAVRLERFEPPAFRIIRAPSGRRRSRNLCLARCRTDCGRGRSHGTRPWDDCSAAG